MLHPFALEQFDMSQYDLVLTSDAGPAKGLITSPRTLHICYCHTPMRYLWDMYYQYKANMSPLVRAVFGVTAHYLRGWDFMAAQRVDEFVTNSEFVRSRILKFYRRDSTVIYPPVDVQNVSPSNEHEDYYLSVGRLVSYKRVDLAVQACNQLDRRLRVIGTGPEYKKLKQLAGPTVEFLGHVSEEEVRSNYARCRALLFPPEEDFGITPVEANAWGRPVIAFGSGGALESVRGLGCAGENVKPTAVFFGEQTSESLANAILTFEANEQRFDPLAIHQHAMKFDTSVFKQRLTDFIAEALASRSERGCAARGAHAGA
jgi:glycosyltransferase involved in cell wall biosynthesis